QEGTKPEPPEPPKEEKKPFNWGKLACNVLAGLAVVAAVTVAAVAVAATAGLAGPVIGAIAIGGAVSGTAAVASMAVSDIARGEVSDMSAYAFVGALSGAIFGPLGAAETLGGKMAVGAVTNGFESIVRQKLNGQDIDWGTVALDGGIGGLTAGAFHYGGKAVDSASPYVKKAFNKVSSKLSENAKYARLALENVNSKANKSVVLGSNFGNVSKKVDDFVDEFKNVKNSSSSIDDLTNNAYKTSYVKSIKDLKNTDNFRDGALEHILEGEINKRGKAVGFHYEGFPTTKGSVIEGTKSTPDNLGLYTGKVEVGGVPKTSNGGQSTFFPENWTVQDVVDAINEAFTNKEFVQGTRNTYRGKTVSGLKIEMYIDDVTNKIISAFPKQ
ncbi:EndoU domain-containing protein, partial [Clostridium butyricum]|uniref:EndoU domain-containing protein n=1 Tax=Clostridium butyricum TaxID=1492 RepID=UPI0032BF50F6